MKNKNNKGFTLIEILAAVVILGIISTIAVPAVYKYVTKTKEFSHENMYESIYDAVKNYRLNTGDISTAYTKADINELVDSKYLNPLIDPADRNKKCSAEVYITDCAASDDNEVLGDQAYTVKLTCSTHSGSKIFNDNGDLMNNTEYRSCISAGLDVGTFKVTGVSLKIGGSSGTNYTGTWTKSNVWIGNFIVDGLSSSEIDHFEYTTDINNELASASAVSFGSNAKSYVFSSSTNLKFRVRVVSTDGTVSAWSANSYTVKIDKTPPEVSMEIINSTNNFVSTFKGTSDSNVYTYNGTAYRIGTELTNLRITAKDDKSGVNSTLKVWYNTCGDDNPNTSWNSLSGKKNFGSNNQFISNGLDVGFRVIKCEVTDKAGNTTTGTIRVKIGS